MFAFVAAPVTLILACLVRVIVYTLVVPFCAVTTMFTVLTPVAMAIACDAWLLPTATVFTFILAVASARVGVKVTDVTAGPTAAVYDVIEESNAGEKLKLFATKAERLLLLSPTTTVKGSMLLWQ